MNLQALTTYEYKKNSILRGEMGELAAIVRDDGGGGALSEAGGGQQ